jgi:anti-sigma-K factor RskA
LTTGKTPPAPSARAVYLASRGALVLQASNMQPLPENKTYELWVIPTSGAPVPAGLFRPDSTGSASVVLPAIPRGVQAKAFGITIENAGGAATPTAPIILSGAAPATGE